MDKAKILVVDDEHLIRWTLEQHLTKEGYEVRTVEDGEKALAAVPELMPDLVLLDNQLPGMNGIEVLGKIRSQPRARSVEEEMDAFATAVARTVYGAPEGTSC